MQSPFYRFLLLIAITTLFVACGETGESFHAPTIDAIILPTEPVRGVIPIDYQLTDDSGLPIQVKVEYRIGSGEFYPATPATGAPAGGGIVAIGQQERTFLWDSIRDVGHKQIGAAFRITAINPAGSGMLVSDEIDIFNDNNAPMIAFAAAPLVANEMVSFRLAIADGEGDAVDLIIRYSSDSGATFQDATITGNLDDLPTSAKGTIYEIVWNAGVDLDNQSGRTVFLEAQASDEIGKGQLARSRSFQLTFDVESRLSVFPLPVSGRGNMAISFSLTGDEGERFQAAFEWVAEPKQDYQPCTQVLGPVDATRNLAANPDGFIHSFVWDTKTDFDVPIVRNIQLRVRLSDALGRLLNPPIEVKSLEFGVNNAPVTSRILISEIYMGDDWGPTNRFFELVAPPGTDLSGLQLYETAEFGDNRIRLHLGYIPLGNAVVGDSGVFLIAGIDGPKADLAWPLESFYYHDPDDPGDIGLPVSIILGRPENPELPSENIDVLDAVAFGRTSINTWTPKGEGSPLPAPPANTSITRDFSDTDADDNSLDFVFLPPSPGEARRWNSNLK